MTTLSKEGLVKVFNTYCKRNGIRANGQYAVEDCMPLFEAGYNAARADIVEANKALVAENERLKATPPDQRQDLHCVVSDISAECRELRTALAAAELREIKLREFVKNSTEYRCGHPLYEHALAQPRDDSALREMIAGVYEECAKGCRKEAVVIVVDGPEERAYNNAISDCELAIRALAEKAKA